jgi:hypothetical protein
VLIPSFYAISPCAQSLRPVRIPNDQNTRWQLSFLFSTDKRKEFLVSSYLPDIHSHESERFATTPHACDTNDNLAWKLLFCSYTLLWLVFCLFSFWTFSFDMKLLFYLFLCSWIWERREKVDEKWVKKKKVINWSYFSDKRNQSWC